MIARAQCADILIGNFRFGTQGSRVFLSPLYYSFSALGLDRVHSFYIHNQCESDGFPQFDQMIPVPMKPIQTSLWQTYLAFNGHNKTIHNHVIFLLIKVAFNYKCWKKMTFEHPVHFFCTWLHMRWYIHIWETDTQTHWKAFTQACFKRRRHDMAGKGFHVNHIWFQSRIPMNCNVSYCQLLKSE